VWEEAVWEEAEQEGEEAEEGLRERHGRAGDREAQTLFVASRSGAGVKTVGVEALSCNDNKNTF
jgi:hypothetical protein